MGRDDLVSNKDATGTEIRVRVRRETGRVVNTFTFIHSKLNARLIDLD